MAKKSSLTATDQTAAPAAIRELVEKFAEHRETYQRGDYKEASLRNDYLNPFFIALGWDVYNTEGKHESIYAERVYGLEMPNWHLKFMGRPALTTVGFYGTGRGHAIERAAQQTGSAGKHRDHACVCPIARTVGDTC